MLPPADPLPRELQDAFEAVRGRLGRLGTSWRYYTTIGSTSDVATLLATSSATSASSVEGAVVIADAQTAGRGRRGRSWFSPPGSGLYVSTVLAPGHAVSPERATPLLTLAAGVALAEAIERVTGLAAPIKWPNDLLVGRRKLAGILAEGLAHDPATGVGPVVLGYGVNIGHMSMPADLLDRTTSLETELGRPIDRAAIAAESLAALASRYDDLLAGRFDAILDAWRRRSPSSFGTRVTWVPGGPLPGTLSGLTAGIDETGALLVRSSRGTDRVVAGELTWEL